MGYLVIARRNLPAQLKPVECRLAGHWRTILAPRFQLARQHRHDRVVPQIVMVARWSAVPRTRARTWPGCSTRTIGSRKRSGARRSSPIIPARPKATIVGGIPPAWRHGRYLHIQRQEWDADYHGQKTKGR